MRALLKRCCTQSKMMLHVLLKWCCMHSSNDAAINVYSSKQPLLRKSTQIAIPPKQHFQAQKQTRPIRHFLWWMRRGQRWYSRYKEKQGRALMYILDIHSKFTCAQKWSLNTHIHILQYYICKIKHIQYTLKDSGTLG